MFICCVLLKEAAVINRPDQQIKAKVHELVTYGIQNVMEAKRSLDIYVSSVLFKDAEPPIFCRRFFPSPEIRNMIYRFKLSMKSGNDQDSLTGKIAEWQRLKQEDNFYFGRSCQATDTDLLFVHQTEWQRKLLSYYGKVFAH